MTDRRTDDVPRRRRAPALLAAFGFIAILSVALAGAAGRLRAVPAPEPSAAVATAAPEVAPTPADAPAMRPAPPPTRFSAITVRLGRNQTLAQALVKLELPVAEVKAVVASLTGLFPFHRARPGDQLRIDR